jgi:hypothetical protein
VFGKLFFKLTVEGPLLKKGTNPIGYSKYRRDHFVDPSVV